MVGSKAWDWEKVDKNDDNIVWKVPSVESHYLISRWQDQNKKDFLDLGCGIGRHTIQFAEKGFNTSAFDLSEDGIEYAKNWTLEENLKVDFKIGDMLDLPYEDNMFDCILCMNVVSHTDTEGMKKIINELYRIMKSYGECYLTLGSKNTWGFKQEKFPLVDDNTKIRMDEGPEKGIPHFYADYDLIIQMFKSFKIVLVKHVEDFYEKEKKTLSSWHYHMLIKK